MNLLQPNGMDTPIIGFRAWFLETDPTLKHLESIARVSTWRPGEPMTGDVTDDDGVHAFKKKEDLIRYMEGVVKPRFIGQRRISVDSSVVLGRVALVGQIVEHERGWRAEFAYPVQLGAATDEIARYLGRAYGCNAAFDEEAKRLTHLSHEYRMQFIEAMEICAADETMSRTQANAIMDLIYNGANVLVIGESHKAKVAISNLILRVTAMLAGTDEMFVTVEKTMPFKIPHRNTITVQASEPASAIRMIKAYTRGVAKRICVEELGRTETPPLIRAWRTGHYGGLATMTARTAREAISFLEKSLPPDRSERMISDIVNGIQCIVAVDESAEGKPSVMNISELIGYDDHDEYTLREH